MSEARQEDGADLNGALPGHHWSPLHGHRSNSKGSRRLDFRRCIGAHSLVGIFLPFQVGAFPFVPKAPFGQQVDHLLPQRTKIGACLQAGLSARSWQLKVVWTR